TPGLALRVTGSGAKTWTVMYRVAAGKTADNKTKWRLRRMTLGDLDTLGLADARTRARNAIRDVGDGKDPATEKQQARKAETIYDLVDDYIEKHAKRHKRSWR